MPVYLTAEHEQKIQQALVENEQIWRGPIRVNGEEYLSLAHFWAVNHYWPREYVVVEEEERRV